MNAFTTSHRVDLSERQVKQLQYWYAEGMAETEIATMAPPQKKAARMVAALFSLIEVSPAEASRFIRNIVAEQVCMAATGEPAEADVYRDLINVANDLSRGPVTIERVNEVVRAGVTLVMKSKYYRTQSASVTDGDLLCELTEAWFEAFSAYLD